MESSVEIPLSDLGSSHELEHTAEFGPSQTLPPMHHQIIDIPSQEPVGKCTDQNTIGKVGETVIEDSNKSEKKNPAGISTDQKSLSLKEGEQILTQDKGKEVMDPEQPPKFDCNSYMLEVMPFLIVFGLPLVGLMFYLIHLITHKF
ncbi:hypothetical protein PTTG_27462 [Puccinia triticina 1-1 BBBD Race 1]|uniref:Uncharacterized protein n=1 Tax=Puccinia triticina (isolate 1-1 / race 1 (BBBD)) TaxID=630390 RepID=A0A180GJU8_PUCT1|nr:hypothetical protein PTTG_27462 [Puccinia triticina 1-1 BBBD Race 1]